LNRLSNGRSRVLLTSAGSGSSPCYRHSAATYRVENPRGVPRRVGRLFLDGGEQGEKENAVGDDGREHEVSVVLGRTPGAP
jgi:hypothetical protein